MTVAAAEQVYKKCAQLCGCELILSFVQTRFGQMDALLTALSIAVQPGQVVAFLAWLTMLDEPLLQIGLSIKRAVFDKEEIVTLVRFAARPTSRRKDELTRRRAGESYF